MCSANFGTFLSKKTSLIFKPLYIIIVIFGESVNITLGLPMIRTSVDHGTALDLAGSGDIDVGSLRCAIDTAVQMVETTQ